MIKNYFLLIKESIMLLKKCNINNFSSQPNELLYMT